jgi:cytoskeletal protein CcmA (bactofilin family)
VFKRATRPMPDQIEVVIGPRATFSGQLRCDGSIRIDGTVEGGTIETPGNVLITESARVAVNITAKTVSIAGEYNGTIVADRVELLEGGRLWGTIHVDSFLLDEGAHFHGELVMEEAAPAEPMLVARPDEDATIPFEEGVPPLAEETTDPSELEIPPDDVQVD